jgi:hypothetical protein
MNAVKNETTDTWHLIGNRGCGAEPDGERATGNWATIRDRVDRDSATRCQNCSWPPR